jgi:hypothetical protein
VTLKLKPHDLDRRDADLVLRGRVLDEKGKPVVNATVEPYGIQLGEGRGMFGTLRGLADPLAVTNEKGEFRLGTTKKGAPLYLEVNAPALAPRKAGWCTPGPTVHEVRLSVGVAVRGRVVKDGKPVPGITLQLCATRDQPGRRPRPGSGPYVPPDWLETKIATDKDGHFLFSYVPPDREYRLWGVMDSCRTYGAVPEQKVTAGASGTVVELGEVAMRPGLRLSGRLVLPDGKPPPARARVVLGLRYEATPYGDGQLAVTGADGEFTFTGLPAAVYEVTVRAPGYHVSPKNRSYANVIVEPLANGLIGWVDRDTDGLRLLLEPGAEIPRAETPAPDFRKMTPEERRKRTEEIRKRIEERRQRRESPLQGAPAE